MFMERRVTFASTGLQCACMRINKAFACACFTWYMFVINMCVSHDYHVYGSWLHCGPEAVTSM